METAYARQVVVTQVCGTTAPAPPDLGPARPVFVTIERDGLVVGCRGDLETRFASLAEEIGTAARDAAAHDPRYRPLVPRDLGTMAVTVTVISRLEPLSDVRQLAPADGLVLRAGGRTGVVLPWEGKDSLIRLRWAYKKAGVPSGSSASLQRMTAERWRG